MYPFKHTKVIAIVACNGDIAKIMMVPQLWLRVGSQQKKQKIYLTWMTQLHGCGITISLCP